MKRIALTVLSALMLAVFAGLFSSCDKDSGPDFRPPWGYAAVYYMGTSRESNDIDYTEQDFETEVTLSRQTDEFEDAVILEPNQYPAEFYQWKPIGVRIDKGAVYEWENDHKIEQVGDGKWKWGDYTLERTTRNYDGASMLKVHFSENKDYTIRKLHIDLDIDADTENGNEGSDWNRYWYFGTTIVINHYPKQ